MRVKCLSLWQPWASLMACGVKTIETRSWPTNVRGEIYIHAAKTFKGIKQVMHGDVHHAGWELIEAMEKALGVKYKNWKRELPFGAIVGTGELVASQPTVEYPNFGVGMEQRIFGDYSRGRHGHLYKNLGPIEPVIPWRGSQGFFYADIPDTT